MNYLTNKFAFVNLTLYLYGNIKTKRMAPKDFYEEERQQGVTYAITSNPEPNYDEPFYQNIFYLMAKYADYCMKSTKKDKYGHIGTVKGQEDTCSICQYHEYMMGSDVCSHCIQDLEQNEYYIKN